jgi:hypothetical protein
METDLYTKAVLGVVAVCLALLVAQGFGLAWSPGDAPAHACAGAPGQAGAQERYDFVPFARGRIAFRVDTQTGETWWMDFPGGRTWMRIGEPGEATSTPEQGESPPASKDQGAPPQERESAPAPQGRPADTAD